MAGRDRALLIQEPKLLDLPSPKRTFNWNAKEPTQTGSYELSAGLR